MPVLCLNEWSYRHTFWRSGLGIILVFRAPPPLQKSNGIPLKGGIKYTGGEKFTILDKNCHFSRKRYKIGPWLLWTTNRKSLVANQSVSVPVTLKGGTRKVNFFRRISVITLVPFDTDRPNSVWEGACFNRVRHDRSLSTGVRLKHPNVGVPYLLHAPTRMAISSHFLTVWYRGISNQILHGNQTRWQENFTGSTTSAALVKVYNTNVW